MRLKITHDTAYHYDEPVPYALQQLRLTPKPHPAQEVLEWQIEIEGGRRELSFDDAHRNRVDLISFLPGTSAISVRCTGVVQMTDTAGVVGEHGGFMPLWMFLRPTPRTRAGTGTRKLVGGLESEPDRLSRLHQLMERIHENIAFAPGTTDPGWSAEQVLAEAKGVCQDMAHVMIAGARAMEIPARYCSGYLCMNDLETRDAAHAWAEAYVEGLGWVGFDPANNQSPDDRYVRVATGLDYGEAAPVSGTRSGTGGESLKVSVEVQEQQ